LIASRTTFWASASTIRVVAWLPEAFSLFFTVSVKSTLSLGAGGPQKKYAGSTPASIRTPTSASGVPAPSIGHLTYESRQKFSQSTTLNLSATRTYAWHAAGRRWLDSPARRVHGNNRKNVSAANARCSPRHRASRHRSSAPARSHPRRRRSRRHARRPRR